MSSCPVCGHNRQRLWFRPQNGYASGCTNSGQEYAYRFPQPPGPVVRCTHCGLVFVCPIEDTSHLITDGPTLLGRSTHLLTSSDLNDLHGSPEEPGIQAYLREQPAKQVNAQMALQALHAFSKPPGRLLDIGCSCGIFLDQAVRSGWESEGIEPSVMHAIQARGQFGLRVKTDILHPGLYSADFFDMITAFQVFEHLVNPLEALHIIHQILKPGGILMIEVPNINTIAVKLMGRQYRHFVRDHVTYFSQQTLKLVLRTTGFQPLKVLFPTRTLSCEHLSAWAGRYIGLTFQNALKRMLAFTRLSTRRVQINLHDIISIIAQKLPEVG